MKTSPQIKKVVYDGRNFYRGTRGYYINTAKGKRSQEIHRAIHEKEIGPIPEGWEVHHKDGDHDNNAPENLEALTPEEHKARHVDRPAQARHWQEKPARPATCIVCGNGFETNGTRPAFICSTACQNTRSKEPTGMTAKGSKIKETLKASFADRPFLPYRCVVCDSRFTSNGIKPAKYCQSKCASRAAWLARKERAK